MEIEPLDEHAFNSKFLQSPYYDCYKSKKLQNYHLDCLLSHILELGGVDGDRQDTICASLTPAEYDKIRAAFDSGQFHSLLGFAASKSPRPTGIGGGSFVTSTEMTPSSAWEVEYAGHSHEILEATIHSMNAIRGSKPYANFLPIIQSSGMGKSRTVDELAKSVFTLPFNFRAANDRPGYPRPDDQPRDFFKVKIWPTRESRVQLRCRYLTFLANLFTTVREEIISLEKQATHRELATSWRSHLEIPNYRKGLYEAVLNQDYTQSSIDAATMAAKVAVSSLLNTILEWSGNDKLPEKRAQIVIYFDESHELTTEWVREAVIGTNYNRLDTQCTAYQLLCWALNELNSFPVFAIFLSTQPDLARFSPSSEYLPSSRSRNAHFTSLQAPFVELPFDVWPRMSGSLVQENMHTLDSVCEAEFMVRFGRPLFWTRYLTGRATLRNDIINFAITQLTRLAIEKLPTDNALLAVLSTRLLLEFEQGRQAALDAESELVAGHMRVAFSIPAHRESMHSGAPSEPILAEAAARVMADDINPLRLLSKFIQEGLVRKGERGELVARLLMTLAHDRAVVTLAGDAIPRYLDNAPQPSHLHYSTALPLVGFLRELVGDSHLQTILESRPDNIPGGVTFAEAFKDARIHFTHFVKAGDRSAVSDDAAWKAMCRGMVFQCYDQQVDIDFVIPLLLNSNETLGRYAMTGLLVQLKNSSKKRSIPIDAEKLKFFSPGSDKDDRRPYITLTMELDVRARPLNQSCTSTKNAREAPPDLANPSKPRVRTSRCSKKRRSTHPRYAISITGCSSTVYGVIRDNEKDAYARLLASRSESLLAEHSRQDQASLDAIRRLKPLWCYGTSYEWAAGASDSATSRPDSNSTSELPEGVSVREFGPEGVVDTMDSVEGSDDDMQV